jgi:hypothetical protein
MVAMGSSKFRANSREPENWLGFLTQNSAYNAGEDGLLGCQRAWRIFDKLAATHGARSHEAYCDLGRGISSTLASAFPSCSQSGTPSPIERKCPGSGRAAGPCCGDANLSQGERPVAERFLGLPATASAA